jgi:hypothetical protein
VRACRPGCHSSRHPSAQKLSPCSPAGAGAVAEFTNLLLTRHLGGGAARHACTHLLRLAAPLQPSRQSSTRSSRSAAAAAAQAAPGTHHVQGGHAEELPGVVDAHLLERLGGDGHGGVDGVGDDVEQGLRRAGGAQRSCQRAGRRRQGTGAGKGEGGNRGVVRGVLGAAAGGCEVEQRPAGCARVLTPGQFLPQASISFLTMPALTCGRGASAAESAAWSRGTAGRAAPAAAAPGRPG